MIEALGRVIGAEGERNRVDGTPRTGALGVGVDLQSGGVQSRLAAAAFGFAVGDGFGFEIANVVDVTGAANRGAIRSDALRTALSRGGAFDSIVGQGGEEVVAGDGGSERPPVVPARDRRHPLLSGR